MYTVYGTPNCPFCVKAKDLLKSTGLAFEYHDIQSDLEKRAEAIDRVPGFKTVPQIFDGDVYVGGFTELDTSLNS